MAGEGQLVHPEHPVLNHCKDATRVKVLDENGNRRFKKRNRSCFIDGMVGLAMGVETAKKYHTQVSTISDDMDMGAAGVEAYAILDKLRKERAKVAN